MELKAGKADQLAENRKRVKGSGGGTGRSKLPALLGHEDRPKNKQTNKTTANLGQSAGDDGGW